MSDTKPLTINESDDGRTTLNEGLVSLSLDSRQTSPQKPRARHQNTVDNFSNSSGVLDSDVIKVEITDVGDDSVNMTTISLKRCKSQVLRPYWNLLVLIGWRGFGRESIRPNSLKWRLINSLYMVIVVTLMFYGYIYEALCCQWKLNMQTDTLPVSTTVRPNHTHHTTLSWATLFPAQISNTSTMDGYHKKPICQHVITTYIIPHVLHFAAYIMGFVFFRIQENEQLYALMERVFLHVTALQGHQLSQTKMIWKLRLYLILGVVWVFLAVFLLVLFLFAFGVSAMNSAVISFSDTSNPFRNWSMFAIQIFADTMINCVGIAVTLNYVTQCEIITFYVHGIQSKLLDRSSNLKDIMKDIVSVRQSLGLLNGFMSQMTSMITFSYAEMVVLGSCILANNLDDEPTVWAYRSCFPIVFAIMLLWPLVQAARMNSMCARFKRMALDLRVFGYRNVSMIELDSFLVFVNSTHLRAKLFHIPIRASFLVGFLVMACFTVLILLQTGVLGHSSAV